jgi:exodeoxyribonuclease V alpha subunit
MSSEVSEDATHLGGEPTSPGAVEGTIERIVFQNEETQWTVARLRAEGPGVSARAGKTGKVELLTLVGNLPGVGSGVALRATGRWVTNDKYGPQFQVASFTPLTPETEVGIERFLGGGLVKGVGPGLAERIVKAFGLKTLEILEQTPGRLSEIPGLGKRKAKQIATAWEAQRTTRDTLIFLQGHGLSPLMAARIHRRYGAQTRQTLQANPYRLMEIPGIGFRVADRIATAFGMAPDAPQRAEAGILHVLEELTDEGNVYCPRERLCRLASEMLDLPYDRLEDALDRLLSDGKLEREPGGELGDSIYPPDLHQAEVEVAQRLTALLARPSPQDARTLSLPVVENELGLQLGDEQRDALVLAMRSKVLIVTGGPGVGKTTLVRGLLSVLERTGETTALAAPTGRAAKRLSEATGREARTLHRLLEFSPDEGRFMRDAERPLPVDLLVVDETSMVDLPLLANLTTALPDEARLVLVGDVDQLPSIGPGAVLRDLIDSGVVPVARLTQIHRQAAHSRIVQNAHLVNQGLMPQLGGESPDADFYFIDRESPESVAATVCELVAERIPRAFGISSDDVQVLAPMHRGEAGTRYLNEALQARLNPPVENGGPQAAGARGLRLGDRVMQLRNDYQREVFNGDIGKVVRLGEPNERGIFGLIVSFDGREHPYPPEDQEELSLAYACSVHKAQGSEYPAVVLTLLGQHYPLLRRNLLYTAMTRGKKLLVVVGSRRALAIATKHGQTEGRFSRLAERLRRVARA